MPDMLHEIETSLPFPVLIADIGGTNARFSIVANPQAEPAHIYTTKTADHAQLDDAIQSEILANISQLPRSAVLAVAGAVDGDEIDLTNNHWVVRPAEILKRFDMESIIVLNDYEAQALAVSALDEQYLKQIGDGQKDPLGNCVVIGPGTGLGLAGMVRAASNWVPVRGEGGHVDFGPQTARDYEIFSHIERIEGRVSGEQLLCGRGLLNLYSAIVLAAGDTPELLSPEEVTRAAAENVDVHAVETIALFCSYLGRIAGDMALIFNATGGVYLTGGITLKILDMLNTEKFRAVFADKAPHTAMIKTMPTYAILHEQAPMVGLAAFAAMPSQYGILLDGRYWRK